MSVGDRKTRLKRIIAALDKLREAELAVQAKANARRNRALAAATDIDAIDLVGSETWAQFPQNWLNFRAKLNRDVTDHSASADAAAREAMRLEKAAERFSEIVGKIDTAQASKRTTEEMLDFVSRSRESSKPALGKFIAVGTEIRKR